MAAVQLTDAQRQHFTNKRAAIAEQLAKLLAEPDDLIQRFDNRPIGWLKLNLSALDELLGNPPAEEMSDAEFGEIVHFLQPKN